MRRYAAGIGRGSTRRWNGDGQSARTQPRARSGPRSRAPIGGPDRQRPGEQQTRDVGVGRLIRGAVRHGRRAGGVGAGHGLGRAAGRHRPQRRRRPHLGPPGDRVPAGPPRRVPPVHLRAGAGGGPGRRRDRAGDRRLGGVRRVRVGARPARSAAGAAPLGRGGGRRGRVPGQRAGRALPDAGGPGDRLGRAGGRRPPRPHRRLHLAGRGPGQPRRRPGHPRRRPDRRPRHDRRHPVRPARRRPGGLRPAARRGRPGVGRPGRTSRRAGGRGRARRPGAHAVDRARAAGRAGHRGGRGPDVEQGHRIAHEVEHHLKRAVPRLAAVTVHTEPATTSV